MTPERQRFEEAEAFGHVADQLNEATLALEGTDYNAFPIDDDLRAVLAVKAALTAMACRYRRDQHGVERREGA